MIEWQDGTLVSPAHVNEDGTITPAVYEGATPLAANNLNKMQADLLQEMQKSYVEIKALEQKIKELEQPINVVEGQEVETGKTVNGRIEYQKRINVGDLPNNSSLVVSTGLSNIQWTRKPEGFAQSKTSQANIMPLPYLDPRDNTASISLSIISEYRIAIVATQDRSSFYGIVDVFYVKN